MPMLKVNLFNLKPTFRQFIRSKQTPSQIVVPENIKSINNGVFLEKYLGFCL